MGNLLDVLRSDGKKPSADVFLDFERLRLCKANSFADAKPTPDEEVVYSEVQSILELSSSILTELDEYKGAGDHIRLVRFHVTSILCSTGA